MANGKNRRSLITNLTVNGEEVVQFEEIANATTSFYENLYKKERIRWLNIENLLDH